jgi:hypothetical protein
MPPTETDGRHYESSRERLTLWDAAQILILHFSDFGMSFLTKGKIISSLAEGERISWEGVKGERVWCFNKDEPELLTRAMEVVNKELAKRRIKIIHSDNPREIKDFYLRVIDEQGFNRNRRPLAAVRRKEPWPDLFGGTAEKPPLWRSRRKKPRLR